MDFLVGIQMMVSLMATKGVECEVYREPTRVILLCGAGNRWQAWKFEGDTVQTIKGYRL